MNNNKINNTNDIEFYLISAMNEFENNAMTDFVKNAVVDFIKEMYGHIPNKYTDIFGDSFPDIIKAFCSLIFADDQNIFKKIADVFKKSIISEIFIKILTDVDKKPLSFCRLAKKTGINLMEDNEIEDLHIKIVAIMYVDVLLGLFDALSVNCPNREIKYLQNKIEYLFKLN